MMRFHGSLIWYFAGCLFQSLLCHAESWPQFRGPHGNKIAVGQSPPIHFGEDQNVVWKTPLPSKAWSSPVIAKGVI